jgi:catechol 2,3-dioxygenase-like lactoylglutathione lyase family enzyme
MQEPKAMCPMFVSIRIPETKAFYQRHFGLEVAFDCGWYVSLKGGSAGRAPFELSFREPKAGDLPAVGGVSVALEVADADAVHADLVAAGVPVVKPPCDNPWGDRSFVALDPNGLNLYLFHPIEAAPEFRSAVKTQT